MRTRAVVRVTARQGGVLLRAWLGAGLALACLAAAPGAAAEGAPPSAAKPGETSEPTAAPTRYGQERPGSHGMAVVGERTIFLSHLPMFGGAHDAQVLLRATFASADGSASPHEGYVRDRRAHPDEPLYTLEPKERFILSDLASTDPQRRRTSFKAEIFRGHFERGGASILRDVVVRVEEVLYFQTFDPRAKPPSQLEYLLFGDGPELFLAHRISRPPDFDQLLAVSPSPAVKALLPRGVFVLSGRSNGIPNRLAPGETVIGALRRDGSEGPAPVGLVVRRQLYFETGDLESPM